MVEESKEDPQPEEKLYLQDPPKPLIIHKVPVPTELVIKVKKLYFTGPIEQDGEENLKFFVLISFSGENFVTSRKNVDIATNSIDFE